MVQVFTSISLAPRENPSLTAVPSSQGPMRMPVHSGIRPK